VGFLKFWSRSVVSCPVAHPPHDGPQVSYGPIIGENVTLFLAHNSKFVFVT
jgi:hypothetical protein